MATRGLRLLFIGPPGVGKGTYAKRLCKDFGMTHLASGDMLRDEIRSGSKLGKQIKGELDRGALVSDEEIWALTKPRILDAIDGGFVLDGFPRTRKQAHMLDEEVGLTAAIQLQQPYHVIRRKLTGRRVCPSCGVSYNLETINESGIYMPAMPPQRDNVCDECDVPLELRKDDSADVVNDRLQTYDREVAPILELYTSKSLLVPFDVLGGVEAMYPRFKEFINDIIAKGPKDPIMQHPERRPHTHTHTHTHTHACNHAARL